MNYIFVDTETTGLDAATCQLLEIGAVCSNGQTFRGVCLHPEYHGEPYALWLNSGLLKLISHHHNAYSVMVANGGHTVLEDGTRIGPLAHIGHEFNEWRYQIDNPVYVGKNLAGFDSPFLKTAGVRLPHRVLDIGGLVWSHLRIDGPIPNLAECKVLMGLDGSVVHEALADAYDCLNLMKAMGHF